MTIELTRRAAMIGLAGTTALASRPSWAQAPAVRVTHFGGPYQVLQNLVAVPFEKAGLGRVEYEVQTTASALAKIQSQKASPPFDVVMMSRSTTYRAGRAGLVMPLTRNDIPALADTIPNTLGPGGFGAGFVLDTFAIMVDKRQVTTPMTSWLDLWRPELRGKIMLPAAALTLSTYMLLCLSRALNQGKIDDHGIELAFGKLAELKPHVRAFYADPNQASQLVARGDIAAAPQLSIRIANNMRSAPTVGRFMPDEGTPSLPFDLSIPVNTANAAGAKKYLNFILGKDIQTGLATGLLATPVHAGVTVPDNLKPFMMLDMSKVWTIDEDYVAAKSRDWTNRWTREVQA
jgi:putative spermidine/putrescine transport system substrate-binding protein